MGPSPTGLSTQVLDSSLPEEQRRRAASDLVDELRHERHARAARRPGEAEGLAGIAQASHRLHQIGRPEEMLRSGCREAASLFGLERTVLSAVGVNGVRVLHMHVDGSDIPPDPGRAEIALEPGSPEVRVRDMRQPLAVAAPSGVGDGAATNAISATVGHPHVVVPIVHAETVIGMFHAAHDDHRRVDELETAGLTAFAGMLSSLWYCSAIEYAWSQRTQLVHQSMADRLDQLAADPVDGFDDVGVLTHFPGAGVPPCSERVGTELTGRALTPRERVVMRYLLEGARNREIAAELVLSVDTVKSHVKRILRKVGAANRADLIQRATPHRS